MKQPDLIAPAGPAKIAKSPVIPLRLKKAAIQGKLLSLRGDSVFAESVDNRALVSEIIGADLLKEIENL